MFFQPHVTQAQERYRFCVGQTVYVPKAGSRGTQVGVILGIHTPNDSTSLPYGYDFRPLHRLVSNQTLCFVLVEDPEEQEGLPEPLTQVLPRGTPWPRNVLVFSAALVLPAGNGFYNIVRLGPDSALRSMIISDGTNTGYVLSTREDRSPVSEQPRDIIFDLAREPQGMCTSRLTSCEPGPAPYYLGIQTPSRTVHGARENFLFGRIGYGFGFTPQREEISMPPIAAGEHAIIENPTRIGGISASVMTSLRGTIVLVKTELTGRPSQSAEVRVLSGFKKENRYIVPRAALAKLEKPLLVPGDRVQVSAEVFFRKIPLQGLLGTVVGIQDTHGEVGIEFLKNIGAGSIDGIGADGHCLLLPASQVQKVTE